MLLQRRILSLSLILVKKMLRVRIIMLAAVVTRMVNTFYCWACSSYGPPSVSTELVVLREAVVDPNIWMSVYVFSANINLGLLKLLSAMLEYSFAWVNRAAPTAAWNAGIFMFGNFSCGFSMTLFRTLCFPPPGADGRCAFATIAQWLVQDSECCRCAAICPDSATSSLANAAIIKDSLSIWMP